MSKNIIQVGFVGCGEMGTMLLEAGLEAGILNAENTLVAETNPDRRESLKSAGVNVVEGSGQLAACEQIVLAVRPQQFEAATADLGCDGRARLAISIMAGIGSERIRHSLGDATRVICCMPNAPVKIHAGVTALMPSKDSSPDDLEFARSLFNTIGITEILPESALWAVTAVSGSGPGYIALFAEAMLQEAIELGLDTEIANRMIANTLVGTGKLLENFEGGPDALREAVTTPGGTTEAGIRSMMNHGLSKAVRDGIKAAHDRGEAIAEHDQ